LEATFRHEKVRLVANALGTPPADVIEEIQASGRLVAALAGSVRHARSHQEAGVDIVVCQGGEGGGHTGDVGSIVLWPEVIDAVAPTPVLAAGGIGGGRQMAAAMAMGAQGVWCGTLWLTVTESDCPPEQKQSYLDATSGDTVRSRSFTGKPARLLRNDWTSAWDRDDTPDPLGMPLQFMVTSEAVVRGHRYPSPAQPVGFNPCGQIVGSLQAVRSVRQVVDQMVEEFLDSVERLNSLLPE
jgi:NAD(P)H-dependent flavin oxidoreductase YrpB (nitropropane dioxygenase family)